MLRFSSFLFWSMYPVLVVSSLSPALSLEISLFIQGVRHLFVIWMAVLGLIYSRQALNILQLRSGLVLISAGSALAAFLWLAKFMYGSDVSLAQLYAAAQPTITLLAAATASYTLARYRHLKLFFLSLSVSIVVFSFINLRSEWPLWTDVYGRPRLLLGFIHPGKLSQLLAILAAAALFTNTKNLNLRMMSPNFIFFLFIFSLVALTSTRASVIILAILFISRLIDNLSSAAKGMSYGIILLLAALSISYIFFGMTDDDQYYITSGRFEVWLRTIAINYDKFGMGMFLWGANGTPVAGYSVILDNIQEQSASFRIDNGYLEVLISDGIFVLFLLLAAIISLSIRTRGDLRPMVLGVTILIFSFGESGLLLVGSWFSFYLLVIQLYLLRAQGFRARSESY